MHTYDEVCTESVQCRQKLSVPKDDRSLVDKVVNTLLERVSILTVTRLNTPLKLLMQLELRCRFGADNEVRTEASQAAQKEACETERRRRGTRRR